MLDWLRWHTKKALVQFKMPEFHDAAVVKYKMHVSETESDHDIIVGRDLLQQLEIDIKFSTNAVTWKDVLIPMKTQGATEEVEQHVQDIGHVKEATERIKGILDAKYEPVSSLMEATA